MPKRIHFRLTAKQMRLSALLVGFIFLAIAVSITLRALEDNLVFFRTPSELAEMGVAGARRLRIGGLVQEASVKRKGTEVIFAITDLNKNVAVHYQGFLPDLFREGQGVVAEGRFNAEGIFIADRVLAKHDETYMPPEVVSALKASGKWQGTK